MSFVLEGITYFSAADVSRAIGVSRQTLWRWRQDGKIPSGRRYRDHQVVFTTVEFDAIRAFAHRIEPIDAASPNQLKLFSSRRAQR
jgi:transcriptional regulator with XRE-family HTH domain